jgi:hypothetical protein
MLPCSESTTELEMARRETNLIIVNKFFEPERWSGVERSKASRA